MTARTKWRHIKVTWYHCIEDFAVSCSVQNETISTKKFAFLIVTLWIKLWEIEHYLWRSLFGLVAVFLVCILKYGPGKLCIWTIFTLCKSIKKTQNQYLVYLTDTSFEGVNRLFVALEDNAIREGHTEYILPKVKIKDYNVTVHGRNFFN